jgi:hypothetical protein
MNKIKNFISTLFWNFIEFIGGALTAIFAVVASICGIGVVGSGLAYLLEIFIPVGAPVGFIDHAVPGVGIIVVIGVVFLLLRLFYMCIRDAISYLKQIWNQTEE